MTCGRKPAMTTANVTRPDQYGVLLLNVGSPDEPETPAVRRYLREFLSDPRVIDIPAWKRWLLLNLFILPFRPKKSAEAYRAIWETGGSPLITISEAFAAALRKELPETRIALGMAYGSPSITDGFRELLDHGVNRLVLAPMFPQYASATTGSVLTAAYTYAALQNNVPSVIAAPPFYNDPGFLTAWEALARPYLAEFEPDHVLLSFHGLPERQIRKSDPTGAHCLCRPDCCEMAVPANEYCYRHHCIETAKGLVTRLGLEPDRYSVAFQSRLGRDPWLTPATDERIEALAKSGVKRLAVLCPAFVADCLETLEEIGIQGKEAFLDNGGTDYVQVPCLNADPAWVRAFAGLLRARCGVE